MLLLSPLEVQQKGLYYCTGSQYNNCSETSKAKHFRSHYGSSALDLAELWFDLNFIDIPEAKLEEKDKEFAKKAVQNYNEIKETIDDRMNELMKELTPIFLKAYGAVFKNYLREDLFLSLSLEAH